MTITSSTVTVSSRTLANGSGKLSVSGGSTWTGATTVSGGTLVLTAVNIVTDFLAPLPPPENPPTRTFQFLAYRAGSAQDWQGRAHVAIVPFWFVAIAMTALLVLVLRSESLARRRRWRALHGCCVHCGYDLRASSERCPECGATIPTIAAPVS
jgi:autotransporter-associated beta strand protein